MAEEARSSASDETTVQYLGDGILTEILLKLPVRSLLLFKSVSKRWLGLIQNPNFILRHINRPIDYDHSYNPMLILQENIPKEKEILKDCFLTFLSDDKTLPYKDDVALEVLFPNKPWLKPSILGPCNGLFCITNMIDSVIFNPATKKCRKVHENYCWSSDMIHRYDYMGFGYDPVSYDYKFVNFHERYQPHHDYPYRLDIRVIIYSLRTNSWRNIVRFVIADTEYASEDYYPFFYNGALHRLYTNKILVFDLHKEDFGWFDLPLTYQVDEYIDQLSVLNESLALIVHLERVEFGYEIWVMLEYGVRSSWTQLYNIRPDVGINSALSFTNKGEIILKTVKDETLSFSNKGEIILKTVKGELASFDVKTMVIKLFNVTRTVFNPETGQLERVSELMDAMRYRESFVSLSEVNESQM